MGNLVRIHKLDPRRVARATFVKSAIDADHRSQRFVAGSIGIPASSLTERLTGRVAFSAEDIEGIARVLKRDPVEFYRDYINAAPSGDSNRRTLVPKVAGSIPVGGTLLAFPTRHKVATDYARLAPVTPLPQGA